ncbi:endonuclease/exonuclease/phosphatase family protein [Sphingobacterium psychroaquaticum]|uniref:endonuclease/exonuclease/phosphatase family protein n=1 Tax=Sphingobacterium psychroaquaticum TaxID=561061 RepID=UPI001068DD89|nr:endonuclease/exonuclease/phosphatase family protein [Sphingobacterium psychroaquaticum]QBQ41686.1 endonuclease/exonuclease/phosphatase family protein [Sphingobacterium psychroaquaticum]
MKKNVTSNRRTFLKKAGILGALPFLGGLEVQAFSSGAKSSVLNVMTCNIRVDLEEDAAKGLGWKHRREACVAVIKKQGADLIGFQEVLRGQFLDLKEQLPDYFAFGFDGPEMDAFKEGYHGIAKNPIFFSKKRFELLTAGGYWLSDTPLKAGSLSWGSARARNACWVRLWDRVAQREIRLVNLHLDHVSQEAKEQQIKVVLDESAPYQADFIQIMTGDFNVDMNNKVYQDVLQAGWLDSYVQAKGNEKPEGTTHGFKPNDPAVQKRSKKIDFIFVRGPINGEDATIVKDAYKGVWPSDHYFVRTQLRYTT